MKTNLANFQLPGVRNYAFILKGNNLLTYK